MPVDQEIDFGKSGEDTPQPSIKPPIYNNDKKFYRHLLWILAVALFVCLIAVIVFAICEIKTPEIIIGVIGAAIGSLTSLFTSNN